MSKLARPGDFCPNRGCDDHGKLQSERQQNIIKCGKTKVGRQRYKCKTCNCTFVETKGTIFYRRRAPEDEIIDTLTLIAEDSRISSLARAKGHKEETIIDWIRAAGQHAERVEEVLLAEHKKGARRMGEVSEARTQRQLVPKLKCIPEGLGFDNSPQYSDNKAHE